MGFINLHAHSNWSDGHSTVRELAIACQLLGFSACVITDHLYSKSSSGSDELSLNPHKWTGINEQAGAVSADLGYPIILGIELSIGGYEEAVVFGSSAIHEILKIRELNSRVTIDDLKFLRGITQCAIVLCHPGEPEKFISAGGIDILDGYEYIHSGSKMFKNRHDPYRDAGLMKICNSDAHHSKLLYRCYNDFEENITSELQLIAYLRRKGPVKHIIQPRIDTQRLFEDIEEVL